jgi:transposase-like protein
VPKPIGQPTKYREEYCNIAVEYLGKGHSIVALAGKLGVRESTAHAWAKKYPEFREALDLGIAKAVGFWEDKLIAAASGENKAAPAILIFGLKNRAPSAWRDVQSLEHTGKDGQAIKTQEVSSREKLFDLVARVSKRERAAPDNPGKPH